MNALIFYQNHGGFRGSAGAFRNYIRRNGFNTIQFISFDDDDTSNGSEVMTISNAVQGNRAALGNGYDLVAYFGHGGQNKLISCDMSARQFINLFGSKLNPGCKVIFYACNVGHPGGMAEVLSRHFTRAKFYGHTTAEDATRNPSITVYPRTPENGTNYIVHPLSLLWDVWVRKITSVSTLYWAEYPLKTMESIAQGLYQSAYEEAPTMMETSLRLYSDEFSGRGISRYEPRYFQNTVRALAEIGVGSGTRSEENARLLATMRLNRTELLFNRMARLGSRPRTSDIYQLMGPAHFECTS